MKNEDKDIKELFLLTQRDFTNEQQIKYIPPAPRRNSLIVLPMVLGLISTLSILHFNEASLSEIFYSNSANLYQSYAFEMDTVNSIDIDNQLDFDFAEFMMTKRTN